MIDLAKYSNDQLNNLLKDYQLLVQAAERDLADRKQMVASIQQEVQKRGLK